MNILDDLFNILANILDDLFRAAWHQGIRDHIHRFVEILELLFSVEILKHIQVVLVLLLVESLDNGKTITVSPSLNSNAGIVVLELFNMLVNRLAKSLVKVVFLVEQLLRALNGVETINNDVQLMPLLSEHIWNGHRISQLSDMFLEFFVTFSLSPFSKLNFPAS